MSIARSAVLRISHDAGVSNAARTKSVRVYPTPTLHRVTLGLDPRWRLFIYNLLLLLYTNIIINYTHI